MLRLRRDACEDAMMSPMLGVFAHQTSLELRADDVDQDEIKADRLLRNDVVSGAWFLNFYLVATSSDS